MSINAIIEAVLAALNLPCKPGTYTGKALTYITFNYTSRGVNVADNAPRNEIYYVQVHYCCPVNTNSLATLMQIKRLLFAAGFTWPTVTDASDSDGQHWILEAEYLLGADVSG